MLLKGIPVSPGIVIGKAFVYDRDVPEIQERSIAPQRVGAEEERFLTTLGQASEDLKRIQRKVEAEVGEEYAQIFDAHLLMLEDELVKQETIRRIREHHHSAEYAYALTVRSLRQKFSAIEDPYLRTRAADLMDIERRVLVKLSGIEYHILESLESDVIVVAHNLLPSETAHMDRSHVVAFVTDIGGSTSHAAIIARALEIPAVVGTERALREVKPNDTLIVDGIRGRVYINPTAETLGRYRLEQRRFLELEKDLSLLRELPTVTLDGREVEVSANIELPEEVDSVLSHGARGIGLYRTEFLYLTGRKLPTEEEQFEAYHRIAEKIAPDPVIIRTLDLGGDKLSHVFEVPPEPNPFLGWRSIRICLEHKDLFETQLRAILRASVSKNVQVMFPMISGLEELIQAKEVLEEVKGKLKAEGVPFDEACQVGAMIEVPSAAMVADQLAEEVDFFSIGTNDLVQYAIAVDRGNERIADLFDPLHPGVLRLIERTVEAGHRREIPVGICGEMCADPLMAIVLLGMGLDKFSMSPIAIPEIKKIIRSIAMEEAEGIAKTVMTFRTPGSIRAFLMQVLKEKIGDILVPIAELDGVNSENRS